MKKASLAFVLTLLPAIAMGAEKQSLAIAYYPEETRYMDPKALQSVMNDVFTKGVKEGEAWRKDYFTRELSVLDSINPQEHPALVSLKVYPSTQEGSQFRLFQISLKQGEKALLTGEFSPKYANGGIKRVLLNRSTLQAEPGDIAKLMRSSFSSWAIICRKRMCEFVLAVSRTLR